jgi:DNA polymerase-3 subunit gamma/tau
LQDGNPCNACLHCRGIEDGSLLDVSEIDAASNNRVDDIRLLRDEAVFTPGVANYRVYIIDEVHMLSTSAFNALLKTLEEPPDHVIFILATTEIHKLPATIISRCQRFDFQRIDSGVAALRLLEVARRESIELDEQAAQLIARLSDGSMRDALSLLDVCASSDPVVTTAVVAASAGLTSVRHLWELFSLVLSGDTPGALVSLNDLVTRGIEPKRLCEQLIGHTRALMLAKTVPNAERLIGCLAEDMPMYREQAEKSTLGQLISAMTLLQDTAVRMGRSPAKQTELELAVVMLCDPALHPDGQSLLRRIERLEAKQGQGSMRPSPMQTTPAANSLDAAQLPSTASGKPFEIPAAVEKPMASEKQPPGDRIAKQKAAKTAVKRPPDAAATQPQQNAPDSLQIFSQWEEVLAHLENINPAASGLLFGTRAFCSATHVLIDATNPVLLEMLRSNEYTKNSIKQAVAAVTGIKYALGPYRPTAESKNDPFEEFIASLPQSENIIIE